MKKKIIIGMEIRSTKFKKFYVQARTYLIKQIKLYVKQIKSFKVTKYLAAFHKI